nr:uncharacterized protein LOC117274537 [Nicotiana tomentosiformis]
MIQGSRQWHKKLPFALLGYRTTARTSVGATPYLLVYGTEAVILAEVEILSLRIIVESEIEDTEWPVIPGKNGTRFQQESASKAFRGRPTCSKTRSSTPSRS